MPKIKPSSTVRLKSSAANAPAALAAPATAATGKMSVAQVLQHARAGTLPAPAAVQAAAAGRSAAAGQTGGPGPRSSTVRGMLRRRPGSHRGKQSGTNAGLSLESATLAAELGMAAPIGPAVIELLGLSYRANVPALLIGAHGLGKSEIAAAAAKHLNIDFITRDLSLLEPPDLVGMPTIQNGATTFFPPDFLPRETGRGGLLLIEEINRAPRYMQSCCLELLTSRRLHSYSLPQGWVPIGCINPKSDSYHVDILDAALISRFMRIEVCAAPEPWIAWARANGIHTKIVEYVETVPNALDEAQGGSNPRSWAYASRTLLAAGPETIERSPDTIVTALNGLIGPVHTTGLLRLFFGTEVALKPVEVIGDWSAAKATMRRWKHGGRLDLLAASMRAMLQWLRPDGVAEHLRGDIKQQIIVRAFLEQLPGDLAEQAKACLLELGHTHLIPGYGDSVRSSSP